MVTSTRYRVSNPRVIHEILDGEVVVINLDTGTYYNLDKAGAHIWRGIEASVPVATIVDRLALRYEATREHIVEVIGRLVERLKAEGLVTEVGPNEALVAHEIAPDEPFVGTKVPLAFCDFQRFADMEELLVLDPIHEVEAGGWPLKHP
jgi:hypothetical protein